MDRSGEIKSERELGSGILGVHLSLADGTCKQGGAISEIQTGAIAIFGFLPLI
jgi:hypothetical protein